MGVCRRVLRNSADAEDAFQATFLVLSRRTGTVAWRPSVSNWLHETAYRLARKIRAADYRRQARERELAPRTGGDSPVGPAWQELCNLLDDELRRLPSGERAALLACYLEDRTQGEAARELGWSLRTLQRRLARGRDLLRARLVRHGLPLPAAFLAGTLLHDALASGTAGETARAAAVFAAGGSPAVRATATALATVTLRASARTVTRLVVACLLLLGVNLAGLRRVSSWLDDGQPQLAGASTGAPLVHRVVDAEGDPLPDRAINRLGTLRLRHRHPVLAVAFTADGKSVLAGDSGGNFILWDVASGWRIRHVRTADPVAISGDCKALAWCDDGRVHVAAVDGDGAPVSWRPQKLPVTHLTLSPDGKTLVIDSGGTDRSVVGVYDAATGRRRFEFPSQVPLTLPNHAFSPDGTILARTDWGRARVLLVDATSGEQLCVLDTGKATTVKIAFSDDGKTLLTVSEASTAAFWDVATGRELRQVKRPEQTALPAYLPGGGTLLSVENARITLRDAASDALPRQSDPLAIRRVVVSADGKTLATLGRFTHA
jgi:RNA polymerase sigma factor (sigma-70 family)